MLGDDDGQHAAAPTALLTSLQQYAELLERLQLVYRHLLHARAASQAAQELHDRAVSELDELRALYALLEAEQYYNS